MLYKDKFVVSILVNGIPQTEESSYGRTIVPLFNRSSYSIRLRNKNNRKAVGSVFIDGDLIGSFVVPALSYVDIKRPVEKDAGFKFVSIDTPEAIDFGKNQSSYKNGVISVDFQLEKETVYPTYIVQDYPPLRYWGAERTSPFLPNIMSSSFASNDAVKSLNYAEGATVEGAQTMQKFSKAHVSLDNHVINLTLQLVVKKEKPIVNVDNELADVDKKIKELENIRQRLLEMSN